MSGPTMVDAVVLARTSEGSKAGPIGLAVILLLCIACYFLFKSMSKHMKTVRENFPTDDPPAAAPKPAATTELQRAELISSQPVDGRPAIAASDDDPPNRANQPEA